MCDGSGCPFEKFLRQLGLRRGKKGETRIRRAEWRCEWHSHEYLVHGRSLSSLQTYDTEGMSACIEQNSHQASPLAAQWTS